MRGRLLLVVLALVIVWVLRLCAVASHSVAAAWLVGLTIDRFSGCPSSVRSPCPSVENATRLPVPLLVKVAPLISVSSVEPVQKDERWSVIVASSWAPPSIGPRPLPAVSTTSPPYTSA